MKDSGKASFDQGPLIQEDRGLMEPFAEHRILRAALEKKETEDTGRRGGKHF